MKSTSFGVHSVIGEAWRVLKTQPKYILLLMLALIVIKGIGSGLGGVFDRQGWTVVSTIWGIMTSVVDMYVGIVTMVVSLKLIRGVKMTLAKTWYTEKRVILTYILATVVYGLMVMGGYLLLIIPGVIIQLTYSLVTFLVVDKQMKVREALAESRRLTTGNRWKIFEIGLVLALINLGGVLAIGLGLLVTIPLSMIAMAVIYTQLAGEELKQPVENVRPPVKTDYIAEFKTPAAPEASLPDVNQYQI